MLTMIRRSGVSHGMTVSYDASNALQKEAFLVLRNIHMFTRLEICCRNDNDVYF